MNNQPPKFILNFFQWFCHPDLLPSIEGDLLELFEERAREKGVRKARLLFTLDVIRLFRPSMIRNFKGPILFHQPGMFRNHFKITIRSAIKQKSYTVINLLGLATGIACFTIIMLYIYDELSYDKFHNDSDRIYRVAVDRVLDDGSVSKTVYTETALIPTMLHEIPEIEKGTRICRNPWWGKALLTHGENTYYDKKGLYVDTTFFDIFSFSFLQGNPNTAFTNPSSIILTESLARKFFGDDDAIGKTLNFTHYRFTDKPFLVSAVLEDVPEQSHFDFDFLVPIHSTLSNGSYWTEDSWEVDNTISSYIKVSSEASLIDVQSKIQNLADANRKGNADTYSIQPLTGLDGIHLSSHRSGELQANNDKMYIMVLLVIALFVILIAGINYVNLATARSTMRAKEIGVRKVVGALRKGLISQFLFESVLMSMGAGLLAIGLIEATLPFFNEVMQKQLSLFSRTSLLVWLLLSVVVFCIGLVAGIYPALYLSAFKPVLVLKKLKLSVNTSFNLRQGLVIFQFGLSALLIVGVLIVQKQMHHIRDANLGFEKDQVVVIKNFHNGNSDPNFVIRRSLAELPGVINVGSSGQEVGLMDDEWMAPMNVSGSDNNQAVMWGAYIDHNYLDVLGIEVIEGRNFSPERDKARGLGSTVILNETAIKLLNVPEPVIGQQVTTNGKTYKIVGVVRDFHATSLHDEIKPLAFVYTHFANIVALKIDKENVRETISQIEEVWSGFIPDLPIDFYFLDAAIEQQYRSEKDFHTIFSTMTGLSLVIACLGLFGLAAFTADQRTMEIGIRKVLGASEKSIVTLLSKEFIKLVLFANIIAFPIAWIVMKSWLESFAYRTEVGILTFLLAGAIAFIIAILTVGWQTFRVAVANPVDSIGCQ